MPTDPQPKPPEDTTSRPRGWIAVEVVALLALVGLAFAHFGWHIDLHPTDEVLYQVNGRKILAGEAGDAGARARRRAYQETA